MTAKAGGRPSKWMTDRGRVRTPLGDRFYLDVVDFLKIHGLSRDDGAVRRAVAQLHPEANSKQLERLRKVFYDLEKASPPRPVAEAPQAPRSTNDAASPTPQQVFSMQKWGRLARPPLDPEEAKNFVDELFAASGVHQPYFNELFEIAGRKHGVVDHEKIEWFRWVLRKLTERPSWWPYERPEIRDRSRRDRLLKIIDAAPDGKADISRLMKKTRWTRDAVVNHTRRLCDDNELIRLAPGLFTRPGRGVAHIPAREQVLALMEAAPQDTEFKAAEMSKMLGRPRQAIDSALHGHGALIADNKVICVRRGVFKLAPFPRSDCST